ncbi:MAG TPA: glycerol-3-phosphate 1-O-acyltransferase PlsY [Bacilli bacterium]
MTVLVCVIICYLLGSVIFSIVIGKLWKGVDIRKHGSGNAGATNALRVMGKVPALLIFALDIAKGVLGVWIGTWVAPDDYYVRVICGLAVIIGHNWPVFFRFKGGKGIATTIGIVATLSFWPGFAAGIIGILAIILTRYVSLGSLLFTGLFPITAWVMGARHEIVLASLAIMVLAFWRHKSNIRKLLSGKENKLGAKRTVDHS